MSILSDIIEKFIKELLDESNDIQIKRNELANFFNCAPSQINYVLTTRFTMDNGYYIESKKGGGGYIKIIKLNLDKNSYVDNIIYQKINDEISYNNSKQIVSNLLEREIITEREAKLILASIDDKVINIPIEGIKDRVRSNIFKNILKSISIYF